MLGEECELILATSAGDNADAALLVSTNRGQILRTSLANLSSWETVREGDVDERTITALHQTTDGKIFVGTRGLGMLSSEDDAGVHIRDTDGLPIYQKNVLYYLVRPNNHNTISDGITCTINDGAYPNGDPFCPHKILIRKVIRKEANAADPETLLTQAEVDAYLTLPDGYDLSGMTGEYGTPGVKNGEIRVVGNSLLSFEVDQSNDPFVRLVFRAVRINEARKEIPGFGSVVLDTLPQTLEIQNSVLPRG